MASKNTKANDKPVKEIKASTATVKAETQASDTQTNETKQIKLVREGEASKLRNTKQKIKYAIVQVNDEPCLQLLSNDGHGLFSNEPVPIKSIEECLTGKVVEKPFSSRILHSLFNQQSNNNAGFLAAVLRKEGILEQAPKKHFLHQLAVTSEQIASTLTK